MGGHSAGKRDTVSVVRRVTANSSIEMCAMRAARSHALLHGQEFFSHENVQAVVHAILEHRLIVRPEAELSGRTAAEIVTEIVQSVPIRS